MQKILSILFLTLMVLPFASSACLTDIEQQNVRALSGNNSANADVILNLFERLCNAEQTKNAIDSFNSTMNARINSLESNTSARIDALQIQLNNSALITSLTQISQLYNQSISSDNRVNQLESKINAKIDNQTLDLITQFGSFKDSVNQQLVDKQTKNLSTNRIIMIFVGVIILVGGFWFYSKRKIPYKANITSAPYDMRDADRIKKFLNDETTSDSNPSRGKSQSKAK